MVEQSNTQTGHRHRQSVVSSFLQWMSRGKGIRNQTLISSRDEFDRLQSMTFFYNGFFSKQVGIHQ